MKHLVSDDLLALILANIQDGVIVTNAEGRITFVSDAAARLIGRDATEAMNSPISSMLNIIDATTRARIEIADALTVSAHDDLLLIGSGGREIPCELRGAALKADQAGVRGMVYTLRDSTERKRAADIHQRMLALVESAEDAIIIKSLDGVVRTWNPAAERLLEYRADEIIGQNITRLLPDDRQNEESLILARMRRGEYVAHFETVRRRKSGSMVDVSLTISPIRDRAGVIVGASKIMRDITERKHYIEQLRHLNAELEDRVLARTAELEERSRDLQVANKELETFSYSVAHDLRAPLRTIDAFAHALLEDCGSVLTHDCMDFVARIRAAGGRMGVLIDSLLDLSRLSRSSISREAVDLSLMVREILQTLAIEQARPGVSVLVEDGESAQADPQYLRIALENLLSNAWKYTAKTPRTIIEFGRLADGSQSEPTWFIRDNGAGFDMKYAARLFGVFERLHSESDFPGLGIGLATVQRIIDKHGGKLWATAVPNEGASFFFTVGPESKSRA